MNKKERAERVRRNKDKLAITIELMKNMFEKESRFTVYECINGPVMHELVRRDINIQTEDVAVISGIDTIPNIIMIDELRRNSVVAGVCYSKEYNSETAMRWAKWHDLDWSDIHLLYVTDKDIYMELVSTVIERGGENMSKLSNKWVPLDVQSKYLDKLLAPESE